MGSKNETDKIANNSYHIPVLLSETIEALDIKPDGVYVDGTAGGGGHSFEIAKRLEGGKLIAFDQDPEAIKAASTRLAELSEENYKLYNVNFIELGRILNEKDIILIDGILLDIGVSSHQFDTDERGFSFHMDAPLDMRMSGRGKSARDVVNGYLEKDLVNIFFRYGEEKYSRSIAREIVKARNEKAIETTLELVEVIKNSVPQSYRRSGHPARKVFQALRIEVNDELENLEKMIEIGFEHLKIGGRFAIITFHSLEDRIVKHGFLEFAKGCDCPPEFPICICDKKPRGKLVFKKPKTASKKELSDNPRSRSAKLRCIERIL